MGYVSKHESPDRNVGIRLSILGGHGGYWRVGLLQCPRWLLSIIMRSRCLTEPSHLWTCAWLHTYLWSWPLTPLRLYILVRAIVSSFQLDPTPETVRIPPLLVEFVSVILVVHKAALYFKTGTPREWAGSRLMSSILRYSVIYFIV